MTAAAAAIQPGWQAALQARPCLKAGVEVFRHTYRGQIWFVFHDRALSRMFRISSAGSEIVSALDGKRSLGDIYEDFVARNPEADPNEAAQFIGQLNNLGLLRNEATPSTAAMQRRRDVERRHKFTALLKNPLALRIPLFDPTPVLDRIEGLGRLLFSRAFIALWLVVVLAGMVVGFLHWSEITANLTDRMLSLENLTVAGLVYPLVKAIHEFSHALALRHYGAEVRRMGVIIVGFVPVPYVDATSSVALPNKYWRMAVAGAGIMSELLLGAIAVIIWSLAEPGLLRGLCYNVVMICGLSTLLFNGNPLQRYDGYYILTDLVEIPALGTRAGQFMTWLWRWLLLGDRTAKRPRGTLTEQWWFALYGPASFVYRIMLVLSISLYTAESYPVIGLVLAVWTLGGAMMTPLDALWKLIRLPDEAKRRPALKRLGWIGGGLLLLLFAVPYPFSAVTQGVVWIPEEDSLRPGVAGEVVKLLAEPGQHVEAGDPLLELSSQEVIQRTAKMEARLREGEALFTQAFAHDHVQGAIAEERLEQAKTELEQQRKEQDKLILRAPVAGTLLLQNATDMPSRFLAKGETVGLVWPGGPVTIRAMVPLWQVDLVRERTRKAEVRPSFDPQTNLPATLSKVFPSGTDHLPSPTLSIEGGGPFAQANDAQNQPHMSEPMFPVEVTVAGGLPVDFFNGLVTVRLDLGYEPLAFQLFRKFRTIFLRLLHA